MGASAGVMACWECRNHDRARYGGLDFDSGPLFRWRLLMQVILNDYQWDFFGSTARFPAMVAGWGSGKTMMGIMKGALFSLAYKGNLGMVVRKVYKDLEQSTIQDWMKYTGQKVKTTRECVFPNGSKVYFRHLDELTTVSGKKEIQNINLGWFYIEQAEELEAADQFEALRGRLRRELTVDKEFYDAITLANAKFATAQRCLQCNSPNIEEKDGIVYCRACASEGKEFGFRWPRQRDPRYTSLLDYMASEHAIDGDDRSVFGLRQGFVIANANGKNWVWRQWISPRRPKNPDFVCSQATTFDNAHNLPADFIHDMRSLETGTETQQRKFRRYVMNCHDEADVEGAYYLKLIQDARREGRIGSYPPDKSAATHTAWDLGVSDSTAIWWFQKIGGQYRIVHYYENTGEGLEHYIRYVADVGKRLKLHYGQHFWPHDGKKRDLSTGKELRATATDMGIRTTTLRQEKKVVDGIERVRKILPHCLFDENGCAGGLDVLEHYRRRKNAVMSTDEKQVYSDTPLHDWASNGADGFRYLSAAARRLGGGMSVEEVRELRRAYT